MAKKIENMSADEIEAEINKLTAQKAELRAKQRLLQAALSKQLAQEAAAQLAKNLSDAQKAALAQVLNSQGIESAEEFGEM